MTHAQLEAILDEAFRTVLRRHPGMHGLTAKEATGLKEKQE